MRLHILVPLALAVAIAVPVSADDCVTWSTSTSDADTLIVDLGPAGVDFQYVAMDVCVDLACSPSAYPYYEVNDIPGLQRGDAHVDDTCHGMIQPDSIMH